MIVGVDPDPSSRDAITDWAKSYFDAIHPYSAGGAYVNFMMAEGEDRIRATYRDNYDRLASIKARREAQATTQHSSEPARSRLVAGPSVKGGVVGEHPSLADLDAGDLKFHTDFRRVYATVLDQWLGCDSKTVLGSAFAPVPLFAKAPKKAVAATKG